MAGGQNLLTPGPSDGLAVRRQGPRSRLCLRTRLLPALTCPPTQWQVGLFEREGQRWMTASTTSCVSGHGGDVAASNPALLTYTRTPRAQAACPSSAAAHASPRSLFVCPATDPHAGSFPLYRFILWQATVARIPPPPSTPSSIRCFEALLHRAIRPGGRRCARQPSPSPFPFHARAPPLLHAAPT